MRGGQCLVERANRRVREQQCPCHARNSASLKYSSALVLDIAGRLGYFRAEVKDGSQERPNAA